MTFNPLDLPPNVDMPHTWCNWVTSDGQLMGTMHTADNWAYATWLYVLSDGAHVCFFKREAPSVMRCFGSFIEGLEKTEEWFAKEGTDIQGWAAWIKRYHVMAQSDSEPDHETEKNGMLLGGPGGPFYWNLERFYASKFAKSAG